ncbi:hypothetical protein AK830_g12455 [Neonectria ditissima]|uniref:Uncharacterized protein n=1 Tax=Neonectria ditissima TaxID=78410 RepID=A0A0P7APJ2_9HYPO|nr:hypothetical protein AK830_g12455 [Neonectria ditissima]
MALDDLPGTVDYLTNAAHLLRMTAPETSAHLMSHRSQLLGEHGIPPSDIQLQRACGGCGLIAIAPWGRTIKPKATKTSRRKTKGPASRSATSTGSSTKPLKTSSTHRILHCANCQRDTKIALPPPGPAVRVKAGAPARMKKPATADALKPTANASSKKRAKNRKAGLQALLSAQQQAANPLSLSHFMNARREASSVCSQPLG